MTSLPQNPSRIEERLQPWIDQAEILIALTLIIMAWAAAWVDLFAFESFNGDIFGRYSLPFFVALIVHTLGFGLWFRLMFSLSALDRFKQLIGSIQRRPLPGLLVMAFFVLVLWSMPFITYWAMLPLYQGAMLVIIIILSLLIFFMKPQPDSRLQGWRKPVLGLLAAWLLLELALHGLAFAGILPYQNTRGLFEPYGFVYQNESNQTYSRSNQYGWYAPDFIIDEEARNILLVGDTYVQGIEVPKAEHVAQQLQAQLEGSEVMPIGQIGYGPSIYLDSSLYEFIWETLEPDEMIVFFHLANDFQVVSAPRSERVYFVPRADGSARVHPDDSLHQHALAHVVFAGHEAPVFIEAALTYSFVHAALRDLYRQLAPPPAPYDLSVPAFGFLREVVPYYPVTLYSAQRSPEAPFGAASFMFAAESNEAAEIAYTVAFSQLRNARNYLAERDITLKLVTIPYFPEAFYEAEGNWNSTLSDDYDLLLPEQRLQAFAEAEGIPFLAMGEAMQTSGLSVADVQALFFEDGLGHLTAAGHAFYAENLATCFYRNTAAPAACYR